LREGIALVTIPVSVVPAHERVIGFPEPRFGIDQAHKVILLPRSHRCPEVAEARHGICWNPWYGGVRLAHTFRMNLVSRLHETLRSIDEADERHTCRLSACRRSEAMQ
jgi:hypothetical protein